MNYIYDGTFEGFLTCVHANYYKESATNITNMPPTIIPAPHATTTPSVIPAPASLRARPAISAHQESFLTQTFIIITDAQKATIVYDAIRSKISKWDLERIYRVFRTNEPEKEMKLLRYIRLGFKQGSKIRLLHTHPVVLDVEKAEKRIGNEVHRLLGLIRFESVIPVMNDASSEILYSCIDPDNDVLEFIAPHFADRFKSDPFIIHDEKRNKALISFQKEWHVSDFTETEVAMFRRTESEEEYRRLWQQYFDIIAIKERTNPKLQKAFMPVRYWKNLPEIR
jgi:probable DNA metabolism protein